MRRLIIYLLLSALVILLAACQSAIPDYKLVNNDGRYYIMLSGEKKQSDSDITGAQEAPAIVFGSVSEMVNDIRLGSFTEVEIQTIAQFPKDTEDKILLFNMDKIYEPTFPSWFASYCVSWTGSGYSFLLTCDEPKIQAYLCFQTKALWESNLEKKTNYERLHSDSYIIDSVGNDPEKQAVIYTYTTNDDRKEQFETVVYTIQTNTTKLHVVEEYRLNANAPVIITILGNSNGQYFTWTITGYDISPVIDDLSQFGIREYVDTESQ